MIINDSHKFEICLVGCAFCVCRRLLDFCRKVLRPHYVSEEVVMNVWNFRRAFLTVSWQHWQHFIPLIPSIQWLRQTLALKTLVPDLPMYHFGLPLAELLAAWLWWGSISGVLCSSSPLMLFSYWACRLVVITYLPQRRLWLGGFCHWKFFWVISYQLVAKLTL